MTTREQLDERRHQVEALTRQGHSAEHIANILGVSAMTVIRDRRATGIGQTPPQPLTAEQVDQARRLLDDGCSYRETARTVECSQSALHRRFPGKGWTLSESASWGMYLRHHDTAS